MNYGQQKLVSTTVKLWIMMCQKLIFQPHSQRKKCSHGEKIGLHAIVHFMLHTSMIFMYHSNKVNYDSDVNLRAIKLSHWESSKILAVDCQCQPELNLDHKETMEYHKLLKECFNCWEWCDMQHSNQLSTICCIEAFNKKTIGWLFSFQGNPCLVLDAQLQVLATK